MESEKPELAVRVSYWGAGEQEQVEQMVAEARERWGLTEAAPWTVYYYPNQDRAGLVEFLMPREPLSDEELAALAAAAAEVEKETDAPEETADVSEETLEKND